MTNAVQIEPTVSAPTEAPVFVALSGGVDSAVVACIMKQEHQNVIGISHRHWPESRCCSTACIDGCAEQCRELGIPYTAVDCVVEFARRIVDDFVAGYERGITPNPCVLCNEQIRFAHMIEKYFELRGETVPANYQIATGHYARVEERDGRFLLRRGVDPSKDQSYMLHRLSQEELSHCVFPLGERYKTDVRNLAEQWNLRAAKQSDSQDICFVQGRYQDFIRQYSENTQSTGPIVDQSGNQLGEHAGIAFYTRGQRSGLGLNGGPWYVTDIDLRTNRVVVGTRADLETPAFQITDMHWIVEPRSRAFNCVVQTRYRGEERACRFTPCDNHAEVRLEVPHDDVTPGQSAVFYDDDFVIGGGIITGNPSAEPSRA